MKNSIGSTNDLQHFGINPLTGEACKYGMRVLCDLNADGVTLLRNFFGLAHPTQVTGPDGQFAEPWNSSVNGQPAIASIMLARSAFKDLSIFALLSVGKHYAVVDTGPGGSYHGVDAERCAKYRALDDGDWTFYTNPNPGTGDRNQHAFTGRTI